MKKEANLLYEISTMRKIVRNHRPVLLLDDLTDNLSTHSYLTIWSAYVIAKKEAADITKVLLMAMAHDIAEIRTGDIAWINKRYVKAFEKEAVADMFPSQLEYLDVRAHLEEYESRETLEAKCVKDADRIAQLIVLREQIFTFGNQQAKEWQEDFENWAEKVFLTKSGKELALTIYHTKVNDWAKNLKTEKRR